MPPPEQFGFNPETTRVEIWWEFVDPPVASVETHVLTQTGPSGASRPPLPDDQINFGAMTVVPGTAFLDDNSGNSPGINDDAIPVGKTWTRVGARTFLIEAADYEQINARI